MRMRWWCSCALFTTEQPVVRHMRLSKFCPFASDTPLSSPRSSALPTPSCLNNETLGRRSRIPVSCLCSLPLSAHVQRGSIVMHSRASGVMHPERLRPHLLSISVWTRKTASSPFALRLISLAPAGRRVLIAHDSYTHTLGTT